MRKFVMYNLIYIFLLFIYCCLNIDININLDANILLVIIFMGVYIFIVTYLIDKELVTEMLTKILGGKALFMIWFYNYLFIFAFVISMIIMTFDVVINMDYEMIYPSLILLIFGIYGIKNFKSYYPIYKKICVSKNYKTEMIEKVYLHFSKLGSIIFLLFTLSGLINKFKFSLKVDDYIGTYVSIVCCAICCILYKRYKQIILNKSALETNIHEFNNVDYDIKLKKYVKFYKIIKLVLVIYCIPMSIYMFQPNADLSVIIQGIGSYLILLFFLHNKIKKIKIKMHNNNDSTKS